MSAIETRQHPQAAMREALLAAGWQAHPHGHPRRYGSAGGSSYLTFEKDGVRFATSGGLLFVQRGTVMLDEGEPTDVIIQALLVDPDRRRQGKASQTLRMLAELARKTGISLYIQPAPLEDKPMSADELCVLYQRFGFRPVDGRGRALVLRAPHHDAATRPAT